MRNRPFATAWLSVLLAAIVVVCGPFGAAAQAPLPTRGLWVQFEQRGSSSGYWPGQVIQQFGQFDPVVGHTVADEAALQLDAMSRMGVNTITIELRTADQDGNFNFPNCDIDPVLGFQWPQPTSTELANLTPFLDLIHSKGFHAILVLVNTHMEEQPPTNSQTWLGAILNVVKNHPALDSVVFNGTPRQIDTNNDGIPDACGIPAEAPLWLGPSSVPATYVGWAIGYAQSLGVPAAKLSSGAIVGDYFVDSQPPAGRDATDGHLWSPIHVLKGIFDALNIPDNQRLYALSFYEHRKCSTARNLACTDVDPSTWADQTLAGVYQAIGTNNGARVVAYEMGNMTPIDPKWSTPSALADLVSVLRKYSADGGSFWRWTSFMNSEDTDPTLATPVKQRGTAFTYNPVQATLQQVYTAGSVLSVTPASDIGSSGNRGGPFAPASFEYQLSATIGNLDYSISGVPSWLDVTSTSGNVTTSPTAVTFSVNTNANSLSAGSHNATITVTDVTHGTTARTITATLTVSTPPSLVVSPASDMLSAGNFGGPFMPSSFDYQLSANGGSIDYSISGLPAWLDASPSSGTPTSSPTTVTFTVNTNANSLVIGTYSATIDFINTTNGFGNQSRGATLTVRVGNIGQTSAASLRRKRF